MTTYEDQLRAEGFPKVVIATTMEQRSSFGSFDEARLFAIAVQESLGEMASAPLPEYFDISNGFRVKRCSAEDVLRWRRRDGDGEGVTEEELQHILEVLRSKNPACRTFMQANYGALVELFGLDEKLVRQALGCK